MKTPREKYEKDPSYRQIVQMLESLIHEAKFTPSELREASILASILYEERNIQHYAIFPTKTTMEALKTLDEEFLNRREFNTVERY
jgi:hypothetical protein